MERAGADEMRRDLSAGRPGGPEARNPAYARTRPAGGADQVAAAGINGPDVYQRRGLYPAPPGVTDILGLEVSGTIVALGDRADDWRVGDVCCALTAGGGYAEYCTAPAVQCLPIPAGLDLVDAAGLPESFFTVWSNVFERAALSGRKPAGARWRRRHWHYGNPDRRRVRQPRVYDSGRPGAVRRARAIGRNAGNRLHPRGLRGGPQGGDRRQGGRTSSSISSAATMWPATSPRSPATVGWCRSPF